MIQLSTLDWGIIIAFLAINLLVGIYLSRSSGKDTKEYFLSGRNMPWWLLGVSMVATTFSADTPNLVTDIVRKNGVSGNWAWWAFCITGMLTVFVYAKLWRRSKITTDLEFYELRYSGKGAAFLRGFRAIYLGVFFNIMIMATVSLAAIKISGVLLGLSPVQTVVIASIVTVVYTSLGGLKGVIITDFIQFGVAMIGTIWAAIVVVDLPQVGGLETLVSHVNVKDKLSLIPDPNDWDTFKVLFLLPIAIQWWSVWYPGAEPGGGGYIAQRMLSAKDEKNAIGATLLFNVAHYALRPWPWILIALASLIVFPDMASLKTAFPNVDASLINDDLAYPAMLTYLPTGLLGLVVAALVAAYMSTISTHLNWGSSYVVNDFYQRFVNPTASQKALVNVGRISTFLLMVVSAIFALALSNALQAFNILLQIGAGTGLLFILRWFWYRINVYSEFTAMVVSFVIALIMEFGVKDALSAGDKLWIGVLITTAAWVAVTFMTKPSDKETLYNFYNKIRPHARGWKPVIEEGLAEHKITYHEEHSSLASEILAMVVACFMVYFLLFGFGYILYGNTLLGIGLVVASIFLGMYVWNIWKNKLSSETFNDDL